VFGIKLSVEDMLIMGAFEVEDANRRATDDKNPQDQQYTRHAFPAWVKEAQERLRRK
jgi:hypothetical protein